jgi:hypothetical protein
MTLNEHLSDSWVGHISLNEFNRKTSAAQTRHKIAHPFVNIDIGYGIAAPKKPDHNAFSDLTNHRYNCRHTVLSRKFNVTFHALCPDKCCSIMASHH